jgi:hypothetical protein
LEFNPPPQILWGEHDQTTAEGMEFGDNIGFCPKKLGYHAFSKIRVDQSVPMTREGRSTDFQPKPGSIGKYPIRECCLMEGCRNLAQTSCHSSKILNSTRDMPTI